MKPKIISKNRMSAAALKQQENAKIDFIKNDHTGKTFFVCGSKKGYISPAVYEAYQKRTLELEDMQYAECSTDNGQTFVPCLMVIGTSNVVASY